MKTIILSNLVLLLVALAIISTAHGEIIYVEDDANGANDGSSWVDAFNDLQDALAVAQPGDEIRVAQGFYTPMGPLTLELPGQAGNPYPADGATGFNTYVVLYWTAGASAISHDVYFGTESPGTFQGNQTDTYFFYPSSLDSNTTYYWRIDEVNYRGKTTGVVWSFTTVEESPQPPPPPPPPPPPIPPNLYESQGAEVSSGDQEATFQLINGVAIKGGYAGYGEPEPDVRDIQRYVTVLYGDLNGDDGPNFSNMEDNSYHIVTGSGTNETAILDGFTIAGGCARYPNSHGGGMYNMQGSPTVLNCTFRENFANYSGGGMYNMQGSPTLINCIFRHNWTGLGGGMYSYDGNPTLCNCVFSDNTAHDGGGICTLSSIKVTDCTFSGNFAKYGGGIYMGAVDSRDPKLTNCIFSNNTATYGGAGGAIYCIGTSYPVGISGPIPENSPFLTNCVISGNYAERGGGIFNSMASTMVTSCLFNDNSSVSGSGIYNYLGRPTVANCTFSGNQADYGSVICSESGISTLVNCILWDGGNEIYNKNGSTTTTYSNVQGGWSGEGNIDADPCFVDPGYWYASGVWIDGDYHLLSGSPCINAGDPNHPYDPNETDLDGKPRVMGGRIDMGAYEYSPPIPAEVRIIPRTINLASRGNWITCYIWLPGDYKITDIDPNGVRFGYEIGAESVQIDEEQKVAVARFSREEIQVILDVGDVVLTITGQLKDGTIFEGTDVVRVIDEGRRKN